MDEAQLKMAVPLGLAIKIFRGCKRLTQQDVQGICPELQQSYLSKVESGDLFPSGKHLELIVNCLGVTFEELWRKAEELASKIAVSNKIDVKEQVKATRALNAKLDDSVKESFEQLDTILKTGKPFRKQDLDKLKNLMDGISKQPLESLPFYSKHMGKIAMEACRLLHEKSDNPEISHSLDEEILEYSQDVGRLAYAACETLCNAG